VSAPRRWRQSSERVRALKPNSRVVRNAQAPRPNSRRRCHSRRDPRIVAGARPSLPSSRLLLVTCDTIRVHDLRHTAAALAVAAGAHPKAIQELCGHASITTTLNTYGHLFESLQDSLAEALERIFVRSRADKARTDGGQHATVTPLRAAE
jgi:integrase